MDVIVIEGPVPPSAFQLVPHPSCRPTLERIDVLIWRQDREFDLDVRLYGSPLRVKLPPSAPTPRRTDDLWKSTCFEAFIRPRGGQAYFELNIAPSGNWAAYRFDSYRDGMRVAAIQCRPDPAVDTEGGIRMQDASFELSGEAELDPALGWDIGLSAVIEEIDGTKSYWALAHGKGPPDFHNPTCFDYYLPPFEPE